MPIAFNRRVLIVLSTAIIAAGVAAGVLSYRRAERAALVELMSTARRCAVAFQDGTLKSLSGTEADLGNPVYVEIKERLIDLRQVDPRVRFVYIFRRQAVTGKVVFLADSEPAGSKDISLPGDEFPEATDSPGLQSVLANGQTATEGPLSDSFGVWVTGYAAVKLKGAVSMAVSPPDILGLDINARDWNGHLLDEGMRSALYVWLLFGLPLAVYVMMRRWGVQDRTIRKLSEAIEQSRSALMITGLDGRIEYVNHGVCEQIGYGRDELIGRDWAEFRTEATSDEVLKDLTTTVRSGRTWEGDWFNRRKSGELYPVNGVVSPVQDHNGRILCYIASLRDMTEARRVEGELRAAKDRAEAGERAKGGFLDTMSHELRTPLNGIVGFTSLLLETPLSSEQREYVQTVRSSGEALLKLTSEILDYSRLEFRPQPVSLLPCEPRVLIEEVLDLLAFQASGKGIELLHEIGPDVPAVVKLDSGRLRQVLVNLVGNAVKFTETGEVEVRVKVRAGDENTVAGPWLEFAVRDTGPGIDSEDQKRLFQPFTQLDDTIRRRYGGTGLGLAISRSLVRLMGGEISLNSELGRGSVFRFVLPLAVVQPRNEVALLAGRRVGLVVRAPGVLRELSRVVTAAGGVAIPCRLAELAVEAVELAIVDCDQGVMAQVLEGMVSFTGRPAGALVALVSAVVEAEDRRHLRQVFPTLMSKPPHHDMLISTLADGVQAVAASAPLEQFDLRVLIVDDNPVNLRLLQRIVTVLGCRSVTATGGRKAIEILAKEDIFDLVMLDLRMPEMDGMEVLRRIRAGEAGQAARTAWITLVTADTQADSKDQLANMGCNDFVPKPITLASCIPALKRAAADRDRRVR
ncbi:MAG: ATP-binding protein [Opitutaceae bacterium]|jgi:PAS domain S-box-containing protein